MYNLSDHIKLFCHLTIGNNNVYRENVISKPYVSSNSHWQHASEKQIHDYQTDLDIRLNSFTLPKESNSYIETSYSPEITTFHDNRITALNESMLAHFSGVKISIKHHSQLKVGMQRWTMVVKCR